MSKKKKLDVIDFLTDLRHKDSIISTYLTARNPLLSNVANFAKAKTLSVSDKLSLLVAKFSFEEVQRVKDCVVESRVEDPVLLSEGLSADLDLCSALLNILHPIPAQQDSSSCSTSSSSSTNVSNSNIISTLFAPPVSYCIHCDKHLTRHHPITRVKYFTLRGLQWAKKVTLRCRSCKTVYNWNEYGSDATYWQLYEGKRRPSIEANDSVFFSRELFDFQCCLANHSWVSFSGFTESFNDAFDLSKKSGTGLTAKQVSSAFLIGEVENELRDLCQLDMFKLKKRDADIDKVLEAIENQRLLNTYEHPNCHKNCHAKGCGRVFVADGIWKLSFPHCMFKLQNEVCGIPVPSLPNVCTKSPAYGKAFCPEHCALAEKESIPTVLRAFLQYCVEKKVDAVTAVAATSQVPAAPSFIQEGPVSAPSDDVIGVPCAATEVGTPAPDLVVNEDAPDAPVDNETLGRVEDVLVNLPSSTSSVGSVIEAQGVSTFLRQHSSNISSIMAACIEEKPSSCKKDTGCKKRLQKWARGHLFIVRAGGHIEFWRSLYKSESPSQVFLILLSWLDVHLKSIPATEWSNLAVVYDNMCHLDNMIVARSPLPLPAPWSHMWYDLKKCVDRLHIRNHTDAHCKVKYHPKDHLEDTDNTMICEQTFVWLSRYKKIVCAMPKHRHLFYIHRMVKRRNKYTAKCYEQGDDPILPVVKSVNTT
ncbi:uncharacterized protein LOC119738534 [Patiria miniata]|uniref:CxC5 like cysteine cluster associated with KDZ domain-containing protein n=1 Tax=Patiria miniata TaxID=46514 RepID=A0A914B1J6_PATMI|nr:uncharacterized protein LOC119738534 [Patiria miniata]